MKRDNILIVDDNAGIRTTLQILLDGKCAAVETIASPKVLVSTVQRFRPDVILLDMNFESDINTGNEGLYWLAELKRQFPDIVVILMTAYADIALAVEGMKRGAFDFIVKPWDNDKLMETLEAASQQRKGKVPSQQSDTAMPMLWGDSPKMTDLRRMTEKIAPTEATVLITGENGTGKDMLANEIHRLSARAGKPMVSVDIGSLSETLFESELFGHVKGAFTDARTDHTGKFELANGTTLFLDEIGNIPLNLQAKLLRVLQNRCVTKVGDTKSVPIDIRLICATNRDLPAMVREGRFREDLYYRINTVTLQLPPLRERTDEIAALANSFTIRYAKKYRRNVTGVSDEAIALLSHCRWPGNVRELQNCIEKAVILADNSILQPEDLQIDKSALNTGISSVAETLEDAEEQVIRNAVKKYNGNLSLVAKALNISRPTLYNRLKKYGI
ncbi:MAG: sigma-54-dependent Fis family transcriptional regulator [Bacteroidales bacterium]|nr:sigma-54-dependent Fis family transcriptional regulator [Bacteroidales bacterium]MBR4638916.1 sigma-54-dependent Fis family transcriptional regulator [Bacteroidales bacterium]MBR4645691.1 sigma-54-dependent Fis family transcriptional regulator [Bacteroidales bacterium]